MVEIRLAEAGDATRDTIEESIFSERFLIKRPLLRALVCVIQLLVYPGNWAST
jgi:hypothetical protein